MGGRGRAREGERGQWAGRNLQDSIIHWKLIIFKASSEGREALQQSSKSEGEEVSGTTESHGPRHGNNTEGGVDPAGHKGVKPRFVFD